MKNCGNITGWQLHLLMLVTFLMTTWVEIEVSAAEATGAVDVATVYQELEGFGASGAWYENWLTAYPLKKKNEIYDVIFGQLGLDIYRLRNTYNLSGGAAYIDHSAQIVQAAKARNPMIKIMISSWSPPGSLKSCGKTTCYNGTLKKDPNDPNTSAPYYYKYNAFAQWWYNSIVDYNNHGIHVDYINMQNEPDFSPAPPEPEWDSCRFEPTEDSTYAGYNQAFEAVYQELDSQMAELPKLLAPETAGFNGLQSYIDALIDTHHAYGYAHHLYNGGGAHDNPDGYIPAMTSFAANYGYKPLLQTEFAKGASTPLTFTDAMNLALLMHNSLTVEAVSAYLYWELFWAEPKGLVSLDNPWGPDPDYIINPVYYAFKQYSAFTDPGWHRVEASTDSSNLRISAYINPDNNQLSVVIINTSTGTNINLDLSFTGFGVEDGNVYRTSASENAVLVGPFSPSGPLNLPEESITTISLTGTLDFSNCAEVQAAGYDLTSDISGDCYVNYKDLKIIADYWLNSGCGELDDCYGADFEPDDDVDFEDYTYFASQWQMCNDPQDPGCMPNW